MSGITLSFTEISGGYGSGKVIDRISGIVEKGKSLCVLGRNGVGKSTFLKIILGFIPKQRGVILFHGKDISSFTPNFRSLKGISYGPQERVVFDNLSVYDNLTLMRDEKNIQDFRAYFDEFPILEERLDQYAGTLSGGEKKILSFVRVLSEDKALVVLDEPSEGVQFENVQKMHSFIEKRKQTGTSFLIVEQNLSFAEMIADKYLVMDQGQVVLTGLKRDISSEALIEHLRV
ncbi:MAG: ATP-binding cassette domain-containing protein [Deltaproteobacteria bacterium]|nr:ATP-binding cassette domain-containing protein [Deltaproteobacteria bacterium]